MKILITGIKGFLGSFLATKLEQDGQVIGIAKESDFANGGNTFASDDLHLINDVPDVIVMCHAAVSSGDYSCDVKTLFKANVLLTERIISRFSTSKVVYVSSASIFKRSGNTICENSEIDPNTNYAASKYWGTGVKKRITCNCKTLVYVWTWNEGKYINS